MNHNNDVVLHAFLVKQGTLRVLQGSTPGALSRQSYFIAI